VLQKEEEGEEKYKENKTNFEGTSAWWIQLTFGIGGAPPRGNLHRKFCVFLLREFRATDM